MCSSRQAALNPSRVSACPPRPMWRSAFSSALSVSHHQHWAATSLSLGQPDQHVSLQPTVFMENQPEVMKAVPLLFSPPPSKREATTGSDFPSSQYLGLGGLNLNLCLMYHCAVRRNVSLHLWVICLIMEQNDTQKCVLKCMWQPFVAQLVHFPLLLKTHGSPPCSTFNIFPHAGWGV